MTVRMALHQAQVRGGGIFLDGVYRSSEGVPVFHEVRGPTRRGARALLEPDHLYYGVEGDSSMTA
jgi:hypothetical protein